MTDDLFELQGVCATWNVAAGVQIRPSAVRFDRHVGLWIAHQPGWNTFCNTTNGKLKLWADHRLGVCFTAALAMRDHSGILRAVRDRSLSGVSILLPVDRTSRVDEDGVEVIDATGIGEVSLVATGTAADPDALCWSAYCDPECDPSIPRATGQLIALWRERAAKETVPVPLSNDNRPSKTGRVAGRARAHPETLRRIDAALALAAQLPRRQR